ncbi:MAG: prepilin-type N-terminal cleavage/methylation domain-containing protein [Verrucomicrobiota bacterium]
MTKNSKKKAKGFTLPELLIAMAIFSIFGVIFSRVMIESAVTIQMLTEKIFFIDERQQAATAADLDMSFGGELDEAKDKTFTVSNSEFSVVYSLNQNGTLYELVRTIYDVEDSSKVISTMVVVDKIVPSGTAFPAFHYYNGSGTQLTTTTSGLAAGSVGEVSTIQVALDRNYSRFRDATSGYDHLILSLYNPIDTE